METLDIMGRIKEFFIKEFEIPEEQIVPEAHLFKDLGLDSIDALDMISMLETEADIEVNEEELKSIRTVQDIVDYVMKKINNSKK